MKFHLPTYLGRDYFKQYLVSISMFILCYMIPNQINAYRASAYHLYFAWETTIPLIPEMMLFYGSLYILPVFLPKLFKTKVELFALLSAINKTLVLSAIIFLVLPTTIGFGRTPPSEVPWNHLYSWLHKADNPYNLAPSYHVILATLIFFPWIKRSSFIKKIGLTLWMILIDISIIFVHQHHLLDLITGFLIGSLTYFYYYLPRSKG